MLAAVVLWPAALARLRGIWVRLVPPPHWGRLLVVLVGAERRMKKINHKKMQEKRGGNTQDSSLGGADDDGEVTLVVALDLLDSNDSGGLPVDHRTRDRPGLW